MRKFDLHGSNLTARSAYSGGEKRGQSGNLFEGGGGSLQTVAGRKLLPAPSKPLILRYLKISTQGIVEIYSKKLR